ncbi:MAG: hypothetical protein EXR29_12475 [Betaproteobacteria bacterium]|nr:hypothetical protein [Betaproteobacteria bacterium]
MFSRLLIAALALLATAVLAQPPGADTLIITGVTVVHPERTGADVLEPDATIMIRGNRIESVLQHVTLELPQGAKLIDGRGKWVIPGLIDGHVHFFQSGNIYTRPDAADFNAVVPYAQEVARNKARLDATFQVWLASGVTGVVDIGGPFWNFDMRDRAAATAAAPRVAVAGPLISMVADPPLDLDDPPMIRIDTVDAGLALVKRELARNPDYIKVWFIYQPGDDLAKNEAIVKAAGDAAHAAGKKPRFMPRNSSSPRRRCAQAPITSCIRCSTSQWMTNSSHSRATTRCCTARLSLSKRATSLRYRTNGARHLKKRAAQTRRSSPQWMT